MKAETEEESDDTGPKIPSYPNTCFLHEVVRGGTNCKRVVALRKTKAEDSKLVQLDGKEQENVESPVQLEFYTLSADGLDYQLDKTIKINAKFTSALKWANYGSNEVFFFTKHEKDGVIQINIIPDGEDDIETSLLTKGNLLER